MVVGPATATPTPIMALVVTGMNDVLNAQGYTQAAWWNRIPGSAWGLMGVIGLFCHVRVGYGSRSLATERRLLFIFPPSSGSRSPSSPTSTPRAMVSSASVPRT